MPYDIYGTETEDGDYSSPGAAQQAYDDLINSYTNDTTYGGAGGALQPQPPGSEMVISGDGTTLYYKITDPRTGGVTYEDASTGEVASPNPSDLAKYSGDQSSWSLSKLANGLGFSGVSGIRDMLASGAGLAALLGSMNQKSQDPAEQAKNLYGVNHLLAHTPISIHNIDGSIRHFDPYGSISVAPMAREQVAYTGNPTGAGLPDANGKVTQGYSPTAVALTPNVIKSAFKTAGLEADYGGLGGWMPGGSENPQSNKTLYDLQQALQGMQLKNMEGSTTSNSANWNPTLHPFGVRPGTTDTPYYGSVTGDMFVPPKTTTTQAAQGGLMHLAGGGAVTPPPSDYASAEPLNLSWLREEPKGYALGGAVVEDAYRAMGIDPATVDPAALQWWKDNGTSVNDIYRAGSTYVGSGNDMLSNAGHIAQTLMNPAIGPASGAMIQQTNNELTGDRAFAQNLYATNPTALQYNPVPSAVDPKYINYYAGIAALSGEDAAKRAFEADVAKYAAAHPLNPTPDPTPGPSPYVPPAPPTPVTPPPVTTGGSSTVNPLPGVTPLPARRSVIPFTGDFLHYGEGPEHLFFNMVNPLYSGSGSVWDPSFTGANQRPTQSNENLSYVPPTVGPFQSEINPTNAFTTNIAHGQTNPGAWSWWNYNNPNNQVTSSTGVPLNSTLTPAQITKMYADQGTAVSPGGITYWSGQPASALQAALQTNPGGNTASQWSAQNQGGTTQPYADGGAVGFADGGNVTEEQYKAQLIAQGMNPSFAALIAHSYVTPQSLASAQWDQLDPYVNQSGAFDSINPSDYGYANQFSSTGRSTLSPAQQAAYHEINSGEPSPENFLNFIGATTPRGNSWTGTAADNPAFYGPGGQQYATEPGLLSQTGGSRAQRAAIHPEETLGVDLPGYATGFIPPPVAPGLTGTVNAPEQANIAAPSAVNWATATADDIARMGAAKHAALGYARGGATPGGLGALQGPRMQGHIRGPGTGQSDSIPAVLSNGEFVIPADVVSHLGDGSTDAGSDKLYEMMHNVRKQKGTAPKTLPPKAKAPEQYMRGGKS